MKMMFLLKPRKFLVGIRMKSGEKVPRKFVSIVVNPQTFVPVPVPRDKMSVGTNRFPRERLVCPDIYYGPIIKLKG